MWKKLLSLSCCFLAIFLSPVNAQDQKTKIPEILRAAWNHYKNHRNFEGDWWSGRYKYPSMIEADGRPNAFQDGSDCDGDGIRDINWQNPSVPYEIVVVSESASYAMLRSVWMNDKKTFDKVWKWTHDNLQRENIKEVYYWWDKGSPKNGWKTLKELGLVGDKLFSWRWVPTVAGTKKYGVIYYRWRPAEGVNNPNVPWRDGWDCAADADYDVALALIFADSLWGSAQGDTPLNYAGHARGIINDLWEKTTVILAGQRFVAGGDNIDSIEPGYLSPATYRIFNDFDPTHDWLQLVTSTYWTYKNSARAIFQPWVDKTGKVHPQDPTSKVPRPNLIPDWFDVSSDGRAVDSSVRREPEFGTDAFRGLWRIAMDKIWFDSKEANDYLKGPDNPTEFFKWCLYERPPYEDLLKEYNTQGKLSTIYWHDGAFCDYESNYEPDLNDPARPVKRTGPRADCGAYGGYLSYFQAAGEKAAAEKMLEPLLTSEANGFSKTDYVITPDWWDKETPEHRARQVPPEKRHDPSLYVGKPFSPGDGWLCQDSDGYYWTVYDHSDWNAQGDYFSNTWAWLGLAMYAGRAKNLYVSGERDPLGVKTINIYSGNNYRKKIEKIIGQEKVYLELVGVDGNPKNRDWLYLTVETSDKFKNCETIKIKLAETGKNTGIYRGFLKIGLASLEADNTIGAAVDNEIVLYNKKFPQIKKTYRIGAFSLVTHLDNFNDGTLLDSSSLYWWQDSVDAVGAPIIAEGQEAGAFIWLENGQWHLVFSAANKPVRFTGTVSGIGNLEVAENYLTEGGQKKQKIPLKTTASSFYFDFEIKNDSAGVVFVSKGLYVLFDIKQNGLRWGKKVSVGATRTFAYSLPILLKTDNDNQSYFMSVTPDYKYEGFYSLKIIKKYNYKDYPYFGAAGLYRVRSDWTQLDEFKMYLYLPDDPGNVQVDIEDINGRVVTLNAYDPYRPDKGPGWYVWSSNFPKSFAVQRGVCDPKLIKFRDFWKGWDMNLARPKEIPEFDLKNVVNIQFSIGGGEKKNLTLYLAKMMLIQSNYHHGSAGPEKINRITFYKDTDFKIPFQKDEELKEGRVYVEVSGKDANPTTVDRFKLKVSSDDSFPGCEGINLFLKETTRNSGLYRSVLNCGLESDYLKNQIGCSDGSLVYVFSETDPDVKGSIKIGARNIIQLIDDFSDGVIFDGNPITWWTDDLDPGDGKPTYIPGADLGYFLWREGDLWQLRWSTDGQSHNFSGSIKSDGQITQLNYQGIAKVAKASTGKEIIFSEQLKEGEDGFTFASNGDYFVFDIKIDGQYFGRQVWIGKLPYKKAYDLPFSLKNKGVTKSYYLTASPKGYDNQPFSMKVEKKYNGIKDYPYFGAWWGFSPELFDWSNVEEYKMWLYLPEDVGVIRVDIEDTGGNVVCLNGYDPWDPEKGPGWYLWHSNVKEAIEVVRGNLEPAPIKDRHWWKGWNENLKETTDQTKKFDLKNIINLEICLGGGLKKDGAILIGKIYLVKDNNHIGFNEPKNLETIGAYLDPNYQQPISQGQPITQEEIYLEVKGEDSNPATVDRMKLEVSPEDNFASCFPINVYLVETGKNTGIYRGKFNIALSSNQEEYQVGACRDSKIQIYSPLFKNQNLVLNVDDFQYQHILDNFDDGKVYDEMPITWWTDEINPEGKPEYELGKDFGYIIWRQDDTWHLRWVSDSLKHEFSGLLATSSQFEKITAVNQEPEFTFKEERNTVIFKSSLASAEAGFDFQVKKDQKKGLDEFLYFVLKIDGVSQGKKVFVGARKNMVYALPFTLYNQGSTNHYKLAPSKDFSKSGKYSLKVTRHFGIKDYPYFGAWGLRGPLRDWSGVDELSFWIYLKQDPGEVRVDIEDAHGQTAVINGYNPWDPAKGPGWYLWRSNNPLAWQAREGNCQAAPIKDRTFWKHWSVEKFDYEDVTNNLDLKNIVNIEFCLGGRETGIEFETLGTFKKPLTKDIVCYIDDIILTRENFHLATVLPKDVKKIEFFSDSEYQKKVPADSEISSPNVFVQVAGSDASPFSVDRIPLTLNSSDSSRADVFPIKIILTETGRNSGVYSGRFKIDQASNFEESVIGAMNQASVTASVPEVARHFNKMLKVGRMTYVYLIEDFSDGNISDRVPVDWWTDDLDPAGTPEYRPGTDLGYFIWRDNQNGWHLRWSTDGKKHTFSGVVIAHRLPQTQKKSGKEKSGKAPPKWGFSNIKHLYFKSDTGFEEQSDEISFNEVRLAGEAGFDFEAREVEYLEFDLKIDDKYLGRQTYVGATRTRVYAIPFSLYHQGITKNITLSVSRWAPPGEDFSLGVQKVPYIKEYPAFGLWGLKKKINDLSNWLKVDRLKFLIYLPQEFGPTRVEIEDAAGVGAILNGYDPVAFKKSNNNWYVWNSAFSEGADVADKIVDPVDFSKRKFWKKWDLETNRQYLEVTQQIGLSNVVNISFMVGGGSSETINFNLGPIWLEKDNF